MFPKKIWISLFQSLGIALLLVFITRLIMAPETTLKSVGDDADFIEHKYMVIIEYFAIVVPLCFLGALLVHRILSKFKILLPVTKVAIYIIVGAVLLIIIWFFLIQPDLLEPFYQLNPSTGLQVRLLICFVASTILVRYFFSKLFNRYYYEVDEEELIDNTPFANTKEFDEKVASGAITVLPTSDRELLVNSTHGSASFAANKIKEETTVKNPHRGLWLGGGYFHHKEGNILTVAAPGSGKGAGIIIPNLLWDREYPHSFVVFDPKGTNAAITARYQRERGQRVIILDPSGIQELNGASHGIKAANFNPLDFIGTNLVKGCGIIAGLLLPDDPKATERIWASEARDLIQGILLHIMTSDKYENERNLVTLYKIFRQKTWEDILAEMVMNNAYEGRVCDSAKKVIDLKDTNERGFGSVVFSTGEAINWLKDPDLQESLKSSDFNPADFDRGGITMYLCIPIDSVELYATWGRLVIGLLLQANARPSGREKAWCYYLLDEFPTMGVFPEVIKALAFSREFKMRIWLFAQNLAQLDRIYSENQRKEILGTCGVFQAFAVNEPTTAKYVSEKLGSKTAVKMNISRSENIATSASGQSSTSVTRSHEEFERPLLFSNEVEKEKDIITFTEVGSFRLSRWLYWRRPGNSLEKKYHQMMIERADKNINYSQVESQS